MEEIININLFYPILFIFIFIIILIITDVIKKNISYKFYENIFCKHTEEHIHTINKLCEMHNKILEMNFNNNNKSDTKLQEIEKILDKMQQKMEEINKKIEFLLNKNL